MRWTVSRRNKDWNLARSKALRDPALEKRETPLESKRHEENLLSSWLREDGTGKTNREMELDQEVREDVGKKGKRVRQEEEGETVVRRKCVNTVFVEAFDIFSEGEISECDSCGGNFDCESGTWSCAHVSNGIHVLPSFAVSILPVVTDVGETAPSVVTVMCEGAPSLIVGFYGTAVLFFLS